jgi:hypothetical protein
MLRNITKLFVRKNGYYYFIINYLLFIYLLTFDSLSLYISLCLLIIMQIICKLLSSSSQFYSLSFSFAPLQSHDLSPSTASEFRRVVNAHVRTCELNLK